MEEKQYIGLPVVLILLGIVLWLLHLKHKSSRLYRYGNKIPGPTPLPFFGNVLIALGKKPNEFVKLGLKYREIYGNVGRGWIGWKLYIVLGDAEDVEVILNSRVHINKAPEYGLFKPWLGDGLLISSGDKWKTHRKVIAPAFHINILKSFIDVFNESSQKVVAGMKSEIGKTFDVHDYMSEITVEILLKTVMGVSIENNNNHCADYAMAVMSMCDILHQRHYKFWLRPEFLFNLSSLATLQEKLLNIIHRLTDKVIKTKTKAYLEQNKGANADIVETTPVNNPVNLTDDLPLDNPSDIFKGYKDDLDYNDENDVGEKKRLGFLDLMIHHAQNETNGISDTDVRDEVTTIMFEGHDTIAAGSSFVLCLLGVHQDIQTKVYNELHEIFGDSDRAATFEDTLHMKYLERVILETLRLYPPVPILARKLTEDVRIVTNNYLLPAGATVVVSPYGVHINPKYYKDPDVFNPDNFLPENTANRPYHSYIPFSAGPRSCVGRKYAMLKLKVLLSSILRSYRTISDVPTEDFKLKGDIILKRDDGFRIRIVPRL